MTLAARIISGLRQRPTRGSIASMEAYVAAVAAGYGVGYRPPLEQTLADGSRAVMPPGDEVANAARATGNGPVSSLVAFRADTVSQGVFRWQEIRNGRPSKWVGRSDLALLEHPWPGGTTQNLLARIMNDVDLGGNAYVVRSDVLPSPARGLELVTLPSAQVDVVIEPGPGGLGWRKVGYVYHPDGRGGRDAVGLLVDEVAHICPRPDPWARWRGMSWLTPVIREVFADEHMTEHMARYFENAATPNAIARYPETMTSEQVKKYAAVFNELNSGTANAGRTAHLGGGVDLTVVGANLRDAEGVLARAAGETRLASAAGVPPVLVGFREGSDASSYAHYAAARRRYVDITLQTLWREICGSLETIIPSGSTGLRLAIDGRDIPMLRDDATAEAQVQQTKASTMSTLISAGFTPESVAAFIDSGDFGLLAHTGLFSVQLQPPGSGQPPAPVRSEGP